MRSEIKQIILLKNFFKIISNKETELKYTLLRPSQFLIQNIYLRWLQSIWLKAENNFPVVLNQNHLSTKQIQKQQPIGAIKNEAPDYFSYKTIEHNLDELAPKIRTNLEFSLLVGKQDVMQYFVQWQRYRKYWWSSITTTPSLFSLNDIKYGEKSADVDVIVRLPWGEQAVENISINTRDLNDTATINCKMSVELALLTILSDATISGTKEGYLRLHRNIAPYKFSFALNYNDESNKPTLVELATLINCRLSRKNLNTWFPDFSLPLKDQIRENLGMGVVYTVVLSEPTLNNGIFHLLNSSTMLQEQVHLGDFDSYALLLCGN